MLATRRAIYQELGGLVPRFQELALIEYCLRATDAGRRVVIVPDARMRAAGSEAPYKRPSHDLATTRALGANSHR